MVTQKLSSVQLRLSAVNLLRDLKSIYTYKQLSQIFGLPESLLCRYVSGTTIPSETNSMMILEKIKKENTISKILRDIIEFKGDGYVDTSRLYLHPQLLELSVNLLLANDECGAKDFDKIVTVVQNGVPLATLVSLITKKSLVIVKRRKESLLLDYYEEPVRESDGSISFLYVRKDYVRKGDKFLFVDDVIRSGKTLLSVKNLIDKGGASIVGALTLVSLDPESVKSLGFSVCKLL